MSNTVRRLRVQPDARVIRFPAPKTLRAEIAEVCASLHLNVPDLTEQERTLLKNMKDVNRGYPMNPLDRLAFISSRATDPKVRYALAETIYAQITRYVGRVAVASDDVWDGEDHANSHANIALRRFNKYPTETNRRIARDAFAAQKAHSQQCIDLLDSLYADKAVRS